MKVLMIARASLIDAPGGDTVQVYATAKHLRNLGVEVDVRLTHEAMDYSSYDLLHFFNIIRPADALVHIRRSRKPYAFSPIYVEYTEYDHVHRPGMAGKLFKHLSPGAIEYCKVIARRIRNRETIMSPEYLWWGQNKSIKAILKEAAILLPNSYSEYHRLTGHFGIMRPYAIIPNGVDTGLFRPAAEEGTRDPSLVLCVARIEGIKNQLNLIKALNDTRFTLMLIGKATGNQQGYLNECIKAAGNNIRFMGQLPQQELLFYYRQAGVHVLPSWFETTGLSSLEAAAMGCSIVVSDRGDAKEYFGPDVCYCDPASPKSILTAVEEAASKTPVASLSEKIRAMYNWELAAKKTKAAYLQAKKLT